MQTVNYFSYHTLPLCSRQSLYPCHRGMPLYSSVDVRICSICITDDLCRVSDHNRVARNIKIYKCIWRDHHIIAYCHLSDYCRIDADPNAITQGRKTSPLSPVFCPKRYALMQVYIFPNNAVWIDCDAKWMHQQQPRSNILCLNLQTSSI